MKIILCLFTAALLCGCSQKPDPRLTKLESQISSLQASLDGVQTSITNLGLTVLAENDLISTYKTNLNTISARVASLEQIYTSDGIGMVDPATGLPVPIFWRVYELSTTVSNLIVTFNNGRGGSPRSQYIPAQPVTGQMPADVAAQIRAAAEAKWPNQYDMQVYEIKQQTEAWQKLHP